MNTSTPAEYLGRLQAAINAHDLDALEGCFASDYRNETPVHPARSFVGAAQVRQNWQQIFGGVPDIKADLVRTAAHDATVWAEWEFTGTRRDGARHVMRGVTVTGVEDGRAQWARFYMEPVDDDRIAIADHLERTMGADRA
jgi:ketosteroid isomerase-like protein